MAKQTPLNTHDAPADNASKLSMPEESANGTQRPRARPQDRERPERVSRQEREPKAQANSIRPTHSHRLAREAGDAAEFYAPPPDRTSSTGTSADPNTTDPWKVPTAVRNRFVQDGHRFYFPDGQPAFRDHGRRLSTPSENTVIIHSLIEIAQARHWQEITVTGTDRFRQETWRQARLAGLQVRGYKPSEAERAALIRALARKPDVADAVTSGRERKNDASDVTPPAVGHTEAMRSRGPQRRSEQSAEQQTDKAETPAPIGAQGSPSGGFKNGSDPGHVGPSHDTALEHTAPNRRAPEAAKNDWIWGRLLDHGSQPYRFDPHEPLSYFVRLETHEGTRTVWGLDLQRALAKSLSQPQIGDEIGLHRTGSDPVTVHRRARGPEGQVLKESALDAQRHRWVIERADFLEARRQAAELVRDSTTTARTAVQRHPELAGTYLQLRAAELAARLLRDPQDQQRFVAITRNALADTVARGEPLQPVRLRQRAPAERAARPQRLPDPAPLQS